MRTPHSGSALFSPTYVVARQRFREAALDVHAQVDTHAVDAVGPSGEALAIDVAWIGAREPRGAVVVTSGLHGVEGFFGSAVQIAWLRGLAAGDVDVPARMTVVLIHAVNPFGFAWRRRADERNVDLNRNFVDDGAGETYTGSSKGYEHVQRFLSPSTAPSPLSYPAFRLGAAWLVARYGMPILRAAVASGQYVDPRGLFYGGQEPSAATALVQSRFWSWTRDAGAVVHLDLHTGLGAFADYQLFVEPPHAAHVQWYWTHFDYERVVSVADGGVYDARGVMGAWLARHADGRRYRFACVEFGTHPEVRVLAALRAENRAHHHAPAESSVHAVAKRELVECFCPRNPLWREKAIARGGEVVGQAMAAVGHLGSD